MGRITAAHQNLDRSGLERAVLESQHLDVPVVEIRDRRSHEQHRVATRQDLRPALVRLALVLWFGKWLGLASRIRDAREAAVADGVEEERRDNGAVFSPTRAAEAAVRIAQRQRRAAQHRNFLELA